MADYYRENPFAYSSRTFHLNPASFLAPLVEVLSSGSTVLDVGCGSGRDLLWLKQRGYRVSGLERATGLADLAEGAVGCQIIRADFESFDFSILEVDAILLVGALVHLPPPELPEVLAKVMAALRPGGWVLITLKEGRGKIDGEDGRTFYLWRLPELSPIFDALSLAQAAHFSQPSITGTGEQWLTCLLQMKMPS
jgi:SAM-dependent methyltransferase